MLKHFVFLPSRKILMKENAARVADCFVDGGLIEMLPNGKGYRKITDNHALSALRKHIRIFLQGGCERYTTLISKREGAGFPSSQGEAEVMDRCYLTIDMDLDGAISWVTTWTSGELGRQEEQAFVQEVIKSRLDAWCGTQGFGEPAYDDGKAQ